MKFCANCGSRLVENAKFCEQCGHKNSSIIETIEKNKTTEISNMYEKRRKNILSGLIFLVGLLFLWFRFITVVEDNPLKGTWIDSNFMRVNTIVIKGNNDISLSFERKPKMNVVISTNLTKSSSGYRLNMNNLKISYTMSEWELYDVHYSPYVDLSNDASSGKDFDTYMTSGDLPKEALPEVKAFFNKFERHIESDGEIVVLRFKETEILEIIKEIEDSPILNKFSGRLRSTLSTILDTYILPGVYADFYMDPNTAVKLNIEYDTPYTLANEDYGRYKVTYEKVGD